MHPALFPCGSSPCGKGEKNRGSGVKKNLKLYAYKQFEGYVGSFGDRKA